MAHSKLLKNVISGFGGQFVIIIMSLVVPRLFIGSYGSDVNGLLSTITQIFSYMALLEAGIGQAAKVLLYKPFSNKNQDEISTIASVANAYYGRFTLIYAAGVLILSFALPYVIKTQLDPVSVFLIVFLEGMSGVATFYFIQTPSIILSVDGRNYINNNIGVINKIVGNVVKITMAAFNINIILLQLTYFVVMLFKVFFYQYYFRKNYSWVNLKKNCNGIKLKDRNSFIIIEICWTIFSSTDMIILSAFISTQMSSIYGVYNMIFANIALLLNAVYSSVNYLLGKEYYENVERYKNLHDSFNSIFFGILTSLMIVCYLLTMPFISLYTSGISDVNYIYPELPLMFCLVQMLSWSRYVSGNLVTVSGRARKAVWVNILEAVINIICSIILVQFIGIVGVLLATVIALPPKLIYCNYVADTIILKRNCWNTIKILGVNYVLFAVIVVISKYMQINISSWREFFVCGILLFSVTTIIVMTINFVTNPKLVVGIKNIYRRRAGNGIHI